MTMMRTGREVGLSVLVGIARGFRLDERPIPVLGSMVNSGLGNALVGALSRAILPNPLKVGDLRVHWDGCHHAILVLIRGGGMVEPETIDLIRSLTKPGMVFVDVGASIGWHALIAASHGAFVYAFEPHPRLYRTLRENVAENNLADRIEAVQKAVSDSVGRLIFHLHPTNAGSSGLFTSGTAIEVETVTLDSTVSHADLVKIDAEGSEISILAGMRDLVRGSHPLLICEFSPGCLRMAGHDVGDLYEALSELGYKSIRVIEEGADCVGRDAFAALDQRYRNSYCNLFCRPD